MPDAPATTDAPDATATDATNPGTNDGNTEPSIEEQLAHWKAMSRKNEDAAKAAAKKAKDNESAAAELAKIREAQMTAEERATRAAEEQRVEIERIRNENVRYKAAAMHGISEENFDLLGVGSEDEILVRAARIGEFEDAMNEVERLREQIALLSGNPAVPVTEQSSAVPNLRPGTPAVKDDSYPAGWFPSVAPPATSTATS